jgi:ubiquinone/menaquinone biosynthesis C-methylase UbiE
VTDNLANQIFDSTREYYRTTLGLADWQTRTMNRLDRSYEKYMFNRLVSMVGSLKNKTVLDLGCGWGGVILEASQHGGLALGIEPDQERFRIAQEILSSSGIPKSRVICGYGERLPFPENFFDIIASYQVLEHVKDPQKVIAEVARVLKPNGVFHFSTPNYMAFWEPHYKVFWLPLMPKWLGRAYLRLRGRDPAFLGHLNYVNPLCVRSLLRNQCFVFEDLCHQSASEKLEKKLHSIFVPLQRWNKCYRFLQSSLRNFTFLVHTCFLNRDQEYLARKL